MLDLFLYPYYTSAKSTLIHFFFPASFKHDAQLTEKRRKHESMYTDFISTNQKTKTHRYTSGLVNRRM